MRSVFPKTAKDCFHVDGGVSSFAVSKVGNYVAIGTNGMAGVYDAQSMKHQVSFILPDSTTPVTNIAFSKDGENIAIKSENGITYTMPVAQSKPIRFLT